MATSQVPAYQTSAVQFPALNVSPAETFKRDVTVEAGFKIGKGVVWAVGTVAAAGTNAATAAVLPVTAPFISVTAADATKGVILPASPIGTQFIIHNVANAVLKVYPPTGGNFNSGTTDAAVSVAAKTQARYINVDGTLWSAA